MKRFFIVFLISIFPKILLAQQFEMSVSVKMNSRYDNRRCDSYARISVEYENPNLGKEEVFYKNASRFNDTKQNIKLKGRIKNIITHLYVKESGNWGQGFCCQCSKTDIIDEQRTSTISADCSRGRLPTIESGNSEVWGKLETSYRINPVVNFDTVNDDMIGYDDYFNVSVDKNSKGFKSAVYTWQYQTVANGSPIASGWKDMDNYLNGTPVNGAHSFSIKPSDFLNSSELGNRLYFRLKICKRTCGAFQPRDCSLYAYLKNPYRITKSAPHIINVEEIDTSCFDEIDGGVKINFDRPLVTNEQLGISIEDIDQPPLGYEGGEPIYVSVRSSSNVVLDSDNSYTFDKGIGKELGKGRYRVVLIGGGITFNNGESWNTYTGASNHSTTFTINEPTPVEFSYSKVDVWCHGGNDGSIRLNATGGTGSYEYQKDDGEWIPFTSSATTRITGLTAKTYSIKVRDTNACIAKELLRDGGGQIIDLGAEITESIEIIQPEAPVHIDFVFSEQPTAFGFSNGRIRAQITGGTPLNNDTYNYTWKHENGTTWTSFSDEVTPDGWFLTLENAIAGTYTLTVTDANHAVATHKTGCTISNTSFTLHQPEKLALSVSQTNVISCHNSNTFNDPSSDGELTAIASGGVPLDASANNGLDYYYTWKKETSSGVWTVLTDQTTDVASGLDTGNYAVNITDANGISVGTATANVITPVDVTYFLDQPDLLEVSLTKVDVFCYQGNDGSIDATITGGTGNYTIQWNTGATTEDINTLVAGTYTISVTDEKGCQAQASITIKQPEAPLEINYTAFFAPTFHGATNGWIEATVTGGTPLPSGAYTYYWTDTNGTILNAQVTQMNSINSYVIRLNNIGAGSYYLTIEDKNHPLTINKESCTIIASGYEIFEPEPLLASVVLHTPISCNTANIYGDPFSDGALEVIAEGGVQLQPTDNNGLPYYYTWKKETSPGVWTVLTDQTTNIARNLNDGHYAVNIEDANGVILGVYKNNVLVNPTDVRYTFEEPALLQLNFEKQDVYCFGGSDSWVKTIITGGTPPYSILWNTGDVTEQVSNLPQGIYDVNITDSRGCQVSGSIQINQPEKPLNITYSAFATPTTGGASDGWIEAQISGGTPFGDGSYTYYWQDETGKILNTQTITQSVNNTFQIRLNSIPKGAYYLTIEDANFSFATTNQGCLVVDKEFILYDPIEAVISIHTPISCHQNNEFNNPYSDGALQVIVKGGLPFASGQPYIYHWKRRISSGGFEDLDHNSNIATGLHHGNYALNVEDSRGVIIGVYESLNLIEAKDATFFFEEPEILEVAISTTAVSCDTGNNATATANITGGIPPYTIQWSNGQNTETATDLIAGNYVAYITDARGCEATASATIEQPGGIDITLVEKKLPSCYQGNDGSIELEFSGGVPPYSYSWSTGATTKIIDNLTQGTYLFTLTDANGCITFKEIELKSPDEIVIDLGDDRVLCEAQTHVLDGSIPDPDASYLWTSDNGFRATTPQITVSEIGTYKVVATSSLGCIATDSVNIAYNDVKIDAEFLLPSQAYVHQNVILFDVSSPFGETSQWILPDEVSIISEQERSIIISFPVAKTYSIGLISTQGSCYQSVYKNIVIEKDSGLSEPGDSDSPFIKEFQLEPNPNNGDFKISVGLAESSSISIRIFSVNGELIHRVPFLQTAVSYTIPLNLSMSSGIYFVVLETAKETQVKRMMVH